MSVEYGTVIILLFFFVEYIFGRISLEFRRALFCFQTCVRIHESARSLQKD
jgi:hypothetical protein